MWKSVAKIGCENRSRKLSQFLRTILAIPSALDRGESTSAPPSAVLPAQVVQPGQRPWPSQGAAHLAGAGVAADGPRGPPERRPLLPPLHRAAVWTDEAEHGAGNTEVCGTAAGSDRGVTPIHPRPAPPSPSLKLGASAEEIVGFWISCVISLIRYRPVKQVFAVKRSARFLQ